MTHIISPSLKSWIEVEKGNDFPIQNIPFGVFKTKNTSARCATRIGNTVIDLSVLAESGLFNSISNFDSSVFFEDTLNSFIELGQEKWRAVRKRIVEIFSEGNDELQKDMEAYTNALISIDKVEMLLPVRVGDYTDFYSSIEHATNVGKMFRDPENALLPNWKHLPVGYHGRSSSIVVSGTNIHRPKGQLFNDQLKKPEFLPTKAFDFELEIGFITDRANDLGDSVSTAEAEKHIFGLALFNDLSARDIQRWEYVPLGPFLAKNFGSILSPWIVTLDALDAFRVVGPKQDPEVLSYLKFEGKRNFDINLEVYIQPKDSEFSKISSSNFKYMYWNMAQQLAHQTVNGCNLNAGDLCASGTISGPEQGSFGSLLEITWNGKNPLTLETGENRTFLEDFDTICIKGFSENENLRIGFGECSCQILPAK